MKKYALLLLGVSCLLILGGAWLWSNARDWEEDRTRVFTPLWRKSITVPGVYTAQVTIPDDVQWTRIRNRWRPLRYMVAISRSPAGLEDDFTTITLKDKQVSVSCNGKHIAVRAMKPETYLQIVDDVHTLVRWSGFKFDAGPGSTLSVTIPVERAGTTAETILLVTPFYESSYIKAHMPVSGGTRSAYIAGGIGLLLLVTCVTLLLLKRSRNTPSYPGVR